MKSIVVSVLAVIALAGAAQAAVPSTFDYVLATQPMIAGKVTSANDQQLVMHTDQGEEVELAMDSKTMVPTDLAPGMPAYVEFKSMPDGHKYARRIIPIRGGSTQRELAYSRTGASTAEQTASNHSGSGTNDHNGTSGAGAMAASNGSDGSSGSGDSGKRLPQTAGNQPLILLLGMAAIALASVLALSRRLRRA